MLGVETLERTGGRSIITAADIDLFLIHERSEATTWFFEVDRENFPEPCTDVVFLDHVSLVTILTNKKDIVGQIELAYLPLASNYVYFF